MPTYRKCLVGRILCSSRTSNVFIIYIYIYMLLFGPLALPLSLILPRLRDFHLPPPEKNKKRVWQDLPLQLGGNYKRFLLGFTG
jgi:hypothetical protein